MNIAIVDDEKISCMQLQALVRSYAQEHNLEVNIETYTDPQVFMDGYEVGKYSFMFLDIYMGDITGLDVADAVRAKDKDAMIIFCTTSVDSMSKAFLIHAFDYIVKPAKPERINQLMDDVLHFLPTVERYVTLNVNRQKLNVKLADITAITTQGHYLIISDASGESYNVRMTLGQLQEELADDERFLSINKGVVVNMDHIRTIEDGVCILTDDAQFPIKIRELTQIQQAISDYRFQKK